MTDDKWWVHAGFAHTDDNLTPEHKALRAALMIVKTPGTCGGDARIYGTRLPVWGIERKRQLGQTAQQIQDDYPQLELEHIQAAFEYAIANRAEIEACIRENEAP